MRAVCSFSPIRLISEEARARVREKYTPGLVSQATIKCAVAWHPTGDLIPQNAKITVEEERSFPELKTYRWVCRWLQYNTPEEMEKRIGIIHEDVWHEQLKKSYGISSTKFDELDQDTFHEYFCFVGEWLLARFGVNIEDVIEYMSSHGNKETT